MISTSNFKTKTCFIERDNVGVDGFWTIALDIGYSAVKGFSNNKVYSFPSFARKLTSQMLGLGDSNASDIRYRDNITGEIWCVGAMAEEMINSDDSKESLSELYGRNRYFSQVFKVISEVGLGIGLMANKYASPENKKLKIQTGLPPAYMKTDVDILIESLSGEHDFSIKIGNKEWASFKFTVGQDDVSVMPQPMGTLLSIATNAEGKQISDAAKYFKSSMLILDPGFGTLDIFNIKNRIVESTETFDNLGMKRVFAETSDLIFKKFNQDIPVPSMQKYLNSGKIRCLDRKARVAKLEPFADLLNQANEKICLEALDKIDSIYNNLYEYDYLVITGGTGAAWESIIRDRYKGMETLTIISGNQNDNLMNIFSNVRGYYMYLIGKLRKTSGKA